MSSKRPPANPNLRPPTEQAGYHRLFVDELIEAGSSLVRLLRDCVDAQAEFTQADRKSIPLVDIATAFDRNSRAVRRSIMLAQSLDTAAPARDQDRAAARRKLICDVQAAIQRNTSWNLDDDDLNDDDFDDDKLEDEDLEDELDEELDSLEDEIGRRPIAEVIADICRDLGLAAQLPGMAPWKRRIPSDIALLCTRAARAPGASVTLLRQGAATKILPQDARPTAADPATARDSDRKIRLVPLPDKA